MVSIEEIKQYFWKHVSIAIPHRFHNGLFWYTGELVSSKSDEFIVLRKDPDNKLLVIPLQDIVKIRPNFEQKHKDFKEGRGH